MEPSQPISGDNPATDSNKADALKAIALGPSSAEKTGSPEAIASTEGAKDAQKAGPDAKNESDSVGEVKKIIDAAVSETKEEPTTDSEKPAPVDGMDGAFDLKGDRKASREWNSLYIKVPDLVKAAGHEEVWGIDMSYPRLKDIPQQIVLQKFLNANDNDVTKAMEQLSQTLQFRKKKKPLDLLKKTFDEKKFKDLGLVTTYDVKDSKIPEVFTWNLYGNVKDRMDEVFVPLEE